MTTQQTPSDEELRAFLAGELPDVEIDRIATWLAENPAHVEALDADRFQNPVDDDWIGTIRQSVGADDFSGEEAFCSTVAWLKSSEATRDWALPDEVLPTIPGYRVLRQLGHGGMGIVYFAEHELLARPVALKIQRQRVPDDPATDTRFLREMRLQARLETPHIARCLDAGRNESMLYSVIEYIDGEPLNTLVERIGPLSPSEAAELGRQAALGLDAIHRMGILHRDVKPANMMLGHDGVLKLLDLGLAYDTSDSTQDELTRTGEFLGTPAYVAPEQARSAQVDHHADLYSLGATLFFLLTARSPHDPGTLEAFLWSDDSEIDAATSKIQSIRPEVPAGLAGILERLLTPASANRFHSAADVATSLDRFSRRESLGDLVHRLWPAAPPLSNSSSQRSGWSVWPFAYGLLGGTLITGAAAFALHIATKPEEAKPAPDETLQAADVSKAPPSIDSIPTEFVIDDSDSGFFTSDGGWKTSRNKIGFKNGYRFNNAGALRARWQFHRLPSGRYAVYMTWPDVPENACRSAFVEISDNTRVLTSLKVDQTVPPTMEHIFGVPWHKLAEVSVVDGYLTVDIDATKSSHGTARADAVRIVRID